MKSQSPSFILRSLVIQSVSLLLALALLTAPICAQQPAAAAKAPAPQAPERTFDNLLAADSYKLYGEVRNVGQLMNTGGAGEIVDPIIKLADPPEQFKSIIKFLKTNAEALATARLLFATWPARTDIPDAFVAIEFTTNEEAAKFAPRLEKFLPTVLPPIPEPTPEATPESTKTPGSANAKATAPAPQPAASPKKQIVVAVPDASPQPPVERPAFVLRHTGNLVLISDKSFKFEKLRPAGSKSLFEDQNFRIAHDRFSSEPVFLFFNVALEERQKPGTEKQQQVTTEAEAERMRQAEEASATPEAATTPDPSAQPTPVEVQLDEKPMVWAGGTATLAGPSSPTPTPTPTKEQQVQRTASSQVGSLLDALGFGEPQWPEAVGVALALDNSDYVIKAILIDGPDAKKLPLPFVPQLISGPAYASDAPSVLPDDTEVFVTASIDLLQTYEGMRKATEVKAKAEMRQVPAGGAEPLDTYGQFEKKAGIKIKDDLLPVFGSEIALAGSLKSLQGAGFNIAASPSARPSPEAADGKDEKDKKGNDAFPMLLLAVKDREAARRLMPRILDGLGIGEANLIAQVERREDTELVNYAGVFAYAFVGNFVVISEAPTVRRVIEASINHQTLSANSAFRNSRRWEPNRTLGQIYISPALMESYHEEVRKQGATLDPAMRDFLLGLDPTASAITYALSNSGLGTEHEIHLPKNLILTTVAGIASVSKNPPPEMNEGMAMGVLQMIASGETTYKSNVGKGKYGTLDELIAQKLLVKDFLEKYGYNFEIRVLGDQFEAVATPREYGKTGKRSFFVDKSGVVRGDDHGGAPATVADRPVQ
ncbi:MAG: hypothetical protein QOH41_3749 [Blastocatellia bacterium]|jgi:hypothetical protein|nr:hypothetical protein [Blastocatellia bacterium]